MRNFPASNLKMSDKNLLCQQYLNIVYHDAAECSTNNLSAQHKIVETSGEILFAGVSRLLTYLKASDAFLDLGSGAGKVVTQVFLNSAVKAARGIELIPDLDRRAQFAAASIQRDLPEFYEQGRELNFKQGDFLDYSINDASVVLINSVCFSQALLLAIGKLLNTSPHVHTVLTLRPIANLTQVFFKKTLRIECSWDTALCYVYQK
jgi:SAM-dependent methyltransferase